MNTGIMNTGIKSYVLVLLYKVEQGNTEIIQSSYTLTGTFYNETSLY